MNQPLHIQSLRIDRLLGVPLGRGWELGELSPGLNVIYGPNGCGKTTTAHAIQHLLWPAQNHGDRPLLAGRYQLDQALWDVELDGQRTAARCDGLDAAHEMPCPPEHRHRYWLVLDELIRQDDRGFAKRIADASQGGYDLTAAWAAAQSDGPKRTTARKKLEEAGARVRAATTAQEQIQHEADGLAALEQELKEARKAAATLERIDKALGHHAARQRVAEIDRQLAEFDPGVARLRDGDAEALSDIDGRIKQALAEQTTAEAQLARAHEAASQTRLSGQGVPAEALRALSQHVAELGQAEAQIENQSRTLTQAAAREQAAADRLSPTITPEQLAKLETVRLPDVSELGRRAERLRAAQEVLEQRRALLAAGDDPEQPDANQVQLREGMLALSQYLACPAPTAAADPTPGRAALAAAVLLAVLALLLAIVYHPAWALLLVPAVPVAILALKKPAAPDDERPRRRRDYQQTRLPEPEAWEPDAVIARLRQLGEALADAQLDRERAARRDAERAALEREAQKLTTQREQIEADRAALAEAMGVTLDIEDEWLTLLAQAIAEWQAQSQARKAAEADLAQLRGRRDRLCALIDEIASPFGYERCENAGVGEQVRHDLATRQRNLETAHRDAADAQRRTAEAADRLRDAQAQKRALLDRLGLSDETAYQVRDWARQKPAYDELVRQRAGHAGAVDAQAQSLAGHDRLLTLTEEQLLAERDAAHQLAETHDGVFDRMSRIRERISQAKKGSDLTEALAAEDAAEAQLARALEQERASAAGGALVDWVRQEAVEAQRPAVFKRANQLLTRVTHGTLRLEVRDEVASPTFLAGHNGALRPVDQLSLGERVQALLAVRLAFVEQDERVQLPLIVDELLGTTDDRRAELVIRSILESVRAGRQVFCFTAQLDEVSKWRHWAQQEGMPIHLIDLAQVRGQQSSDRRPLQVEPMQLTAPPAPEGANWHAYGRKLGVPQLDPAQAAGDGRLNSAAVHAWYVVHDCEALHALLADHIETWAQLQNLLSVGGHGRLGQGQVERVRAAGRAVEAVCELWRIGRGRRVDRAVLEQSGAVSQTFIDEVSQLAEKLGGDGGQLLAALEDKQVSRWQQSKTEELRAYFAEHGYVDDEPVLSSDQLRVAALGRAMADIEAGLIDSRWVQELVASLPGLGPR